MKLGIALSGGGIRGIAHVGVLKALEENNISVDVIGGTSSGGLIASLYALGYSPIYIYETFKKYAGQITNVSSTPIVSGISDFIMKRKVKLLGLKTGKSIERICDDLAEKKGIRNVGDITSIPLVMPTVDIGNSKKYVFTNSIPEKVVNKSQYITDISLGKAIRASSSFPGVFCPCKYKEYKFLDGGILDNTPVFEVKKQGADKVIAINFKSDDVNESSNIMDIAVRTIDIMGNKIAQESLEVSDLVLTIETNKTGLLDVNRLEECYNYGYKETLKNIHKIKSMMDDKL